MVSFSVAKSGFGGYLAFTTIFLSLATPACAPPNPFANAASPAPGPSIVSDPSTPPPPPLGQRLSMSSEGAPSGRSGHVSLTLGGQFLVATGENTAFGLADGGLYDPPSDSWLSAGLSLPSPLSARFLAAGAAGQAGGQNAAFIWGGSEFVSVTEMKGTRLGDGAVYYPASNSWDTVAATLANSPSPRSDHCAVFGGGDFIVWGGESYGVALGDGGIYNPVSKSWTTIPSLGSGSPAFFSPSAREGMACFWDASLSRMLMYGGFAGESYDELWAFDPQSVQWEKITTSGASLIPRLYPTVGFGGGLLFIYGGSNGANLQSGVIIDMASQLAYSTAEGGGPYATLNDDHQAAWDGQGFVLSGLDSAQTATAAYRLAVSGSGASLTTAWELLSSASTPLDDSPNVGLSVRQVGADVIFWGGRNHSGIMNSQGMRFAPPWLAH